MKGKKTNNKLLLPFLVVIGIILAVIFSQSFSVGLDISKDTVYQPRFTNIECGVIYEDYTESFDFYDIQDSNGWVTLDCGYGNHNIHTNRCEIDFTIQEQGIFGDARLDPIYICSRSTSFDEREAKCEKPERFTGLELKQNEFIMARGRDRLSLGSLEEGELTIKRTANWYGLRITDSSNFLSTESSCDVSDIIVDNGFSILKRDEANLQNGILDFNAKMNYISASYPAVSKNIIYYKDEVVWTIGNQEVCPVEPDVNGVSFVNTLKCYPANDIICNPALPTCSDDGKSLTDLDATGKECNELYGNFLNQYIQDTKNTNIVCKKDCVDGELVSYDCKTIPECPDGRLDDNYNCVKIDHDEPVIETTDATTLIILGFFGIVILMMVLIKIRMKGGRK